MNAKELPWHEPSLDGLLTSLDSLPHALLLTGTPGIGKSRFATALAAALLCEAPGLRRRACGRCDACGWFAADNHPDFRRLEPQVDDEGKPSREIRIDQVRALAGFVNVGAHRGGRRVVIVDPADALNAPSANALLKTLEEPSDGVVFVLVTSHADAVPATIRSRCRRHPLASPAMTEAAEWLQGETGCGAADARAWLAMAGGAPLHAARFAEPAQAAAHRAMLEAIAGLPDTSPIAVADALQAWEGRQWLPVLQRWVMDLMRVGAGAAPRYFPAMQDRLGELARRSGDAALERAGRALAAQFRHVEHPLNARLFCEASLDAYLAAFGSGRNGTER